MELVLTASRAYPALLARRLALRSHAVVTLPGS